MPGSKGVLLAQLLIVHFVNAGGKGNSISGIVTGSLASCMITTAAHSGCAARGWMLVLARQTADRAGATRETGLKGRAPLQRCRRCLHQMSTGRIAHQLFDVLDDVSTCMTWGRWCAQQRAPSLPCPCSFDATACAPDRPASGAWRAAKARPLRGGGCVGWGASSVSASSSSSRATCTEAATAAAVVDVLSCTPTGQCSRER
jgi:hypothetical protein